jgi:hypothetical protein
VPNARSANVCKEKSSGRTNDVLVRDVDDPLEPKRTDLPVHRLGGLADDVPPREHPVRRDPAPSAPGVAP